MYQDVAEEFFDEDLEKDLEFLDLASATQGVGLGNLAIQKAKDVLSWEEIAKKGCVMEYVLFTFMYVCMYVDRYVLYDGQRKIHL